jgi:hypothetical protein
MCKTEGEMSVASHGGLRYLRAKAVRGSQQASNPERRCDLERRLLACSSFATLAPARLRPCAPVHPAARRRAGARPGGCLGTSRAGGAGIAQVTGVSTLTLTVTP